MNPASTIRLIESLIAVAQFGVETCDDPLQKNWFHGAQYALTDFLHLYKKFTSIKGDAALD